jgi:hypothetical protein
VQEKTKKRMANIFAQKATKYKISQNTDGEKSKTFLQKNLYCFLLKTLF